MDRKRGKNNAEQSTPVSLLGECLQWLSVHTKPNKAQWVSISCTKGDTFLCKHSGYVTQPCYKVFRYCYATNKTATKQGLPWLFFHAFCSMAVILVAICTGQNEYPCFKLLQVLMQVGIFYVSHLWPIMRFVEWNWGSVKYFHQRWLHLQAKCVICMVEMLSFKPDNCGFRKDSRFSTW